MVQREVAERLVAAPGRSEYGLLSATAHLYARVEKMFTLPPGAFSPPPKVESTVVRLRMEPKIDSLHVPEAEFISFLKLSFGQKRKTLWNNLKARYQPAALRAALEKAGSQADSSRRSSESGRRRHCFGRWQQSQRCGSSRYRRGAVET